MNNNQTIKTITLKEVSIQLVYLKALQQAKITKP